MTRLKIYRQYAHGDYFCPRRTIDVDTSRDCSADLAALVVASIDHPKEGEVVLAQWEANPNNILAFRVRAQVTCERVRL